MVVACATGLTSYATDDEAKIKANGFGTASEDEDVYSSAGDEAAEDVEEVENHCGDGGGGGDDLATEDTDDEEDEVDNKLVEFVIKSSSEYKTAVEASSNCSKHIRRRPSLICKRKFMA